ncbi:MAG: hypothetical protein IKP58_11030 [Victivallales bacterium]|nr:hypothetical protein [Victivallales bacterium]
MLNRMLLFLSMMLLLAGCHKESKPEAAQPLTEEWKDGSVTLRLIVENPDVTIDDDVVLRVEVEGTEGIDVVFPDLKADVFEAFEVDSAKSSERKLTAQGTMLFSRSYILEPLDSGSCKITPFEIDVKDGDETRNVETKELAIDVKPSVDGGDGKLHDDELVPMDVRPPWRKGWLAWCVGGMAAVAAIVLIIWCCRRREKVVEEKRKSPLETALAALEQLEKDDLIAKGELKEYYGRVSSILREYVEGRYGLQAPERTTEEFMEDLRHDSGLLSQDQKSLLEKFLMHCDLVKFAKFEPSADEIRVTFESCRDFIVSSGDKVNE